MIYASKTIEKWNEQKSKLREKFPELTDDDLGYDYGKKDVMLSNLESILGKTREELHDVIDTL